MTRYQMQHEIYTLMMKIYPELQHDQVENHLKDLWKCQDDYLMRYLETTKEIASWKLQ
jgi:hypothetical protein